MSYTEHFDFQDKKILYCVLDWGLGHASRSIPIIEHLVKSNSVLIAGSGNSLTLLKKEFGNALDYVDLGGQEVKYTFKFMWLNMLYHLPVLAIQFFRERFFINKYVKESGVDFIISDHRYGCYSNQIPSYIIAHQLRIIHRFKFVSRLGSWVNAQLINKFEKCLIPDYENARLSGDLSRNKHIRNTEFIGSLSRLKKNDSIANGKILVILSGPEPSRTQLEQELLLEIKDSLHTFLIIRGKKGLSPLDIDDRDVIDIADSELVTTLMNSCDLVISRCGYSSLMDLDEMDKKAILIPTPGQTEQEYLADYHGNHPNWIFQKQCEIDLSVLDQLLN